MVQEVQHGEQEQCQCLLHNDLNRPQHAHMKILYFELSIDSTQRPTNHTGILLPRSPPKNRFTGASCIKQAAPNRLPSC